MKGAVMTGKDLSDAEKAYIREIAFEVGEVILRRHVESCPVAKKITKYIWLAVGISIGAGFGGGLTIAKVIGI